MQKKKNEKEKEGISYVDVTYGIEFRNKYNDSKVAWNKTTHPYHV